MNTTLIWLGIIFCISQSAMFSGLNLAFFSITKLRLEIESKKDNPHALKVAKLRQGSNFLLTTILWGAVQFFNEKDFRELLKIHGKDSSSLRPNGYERHPKGHVPYWSKSFSKLIRSFNQPNIFQARRD